MPADLRLAGGRVWTRGRLAPVDLLVAGDRISAVVGPETETPGVDRVVDCTGKVILPGMIDVHVHTREPGFTAKEDIATATAQAAAGGVTTIFGMPNLDPPTTTVEALEEVFGLYERKAIVDWNHNPAPTQLEQIGKMGEMGVRAFKVYMVVDTHRSYPHPPGVGIHDHGVLLQVMDEVAGTGLRLIVHPHDQALMNTIERTYLDRGENTPAAYAQAFAARDGVIWDTAVGVLLRLAEAAGCPLHLAHMQTRRAIDAVGRAKRDGVDVTCEVNHWALFLSRWEHVERLGPYALSYWVPDDARGAVWDGVREGVIDVIASDHAPHLREEKEIGWTQMWSAHTGTPGIQYFYPLLLGAVTEGLLPLDRAVALAAETPARAFGLGRRKGCIEVGFDADLVVADLDSPWTITNEGVLSRCGWTPYDGVSCRARIERTFVRGTEVYAEGEVVGRPGHGRMATA